MFLVVVQTRTADHAGMFIKAATTALPELEAENNIVLR